MSTLEALPLKIIRQFIKTVWKNRDYGIVSDFFKSDALILSPLFATPEIGITAMQKILQTWHTAFPDLKTCAELIFYDRVHNTVITQFTCEGIYRADSECHDYFECLPNHTIKYTGAGFYQFCDQDFTKIVQYSSLVHWPKPLMLHNIPQDSQKNALQKILHYPELTPQEIKCLALWLRDQSYQDIADYLGNISKLTVKKHLENIRNKLLITNKSELFDLLQKTGTLMAYLKFAEKLVTTVKTETDPEIDS